ncbi:MAG: hypothetical protein HS117_12345 [Verrucomicrobiaceae bacterium]|nr:hypothetical protein [Verrucomicrobiaceae bacterium]
MLDAQRNRGAIYREEILFARKLLWCHMIGGAAILALLLFHELFAWFGGALVWYAATVFTMLGFMNEQRCCRWLLGGLFAVLASSGIYFTTTVFPGLEPVKAPLIPHSFLPVWVGMANLAYAGGTVMMLFSNRIRKAGSVGFSLW